MNKIIKQFSSIETVDKYILICLTVVSGLLAVLFWKMDLAIYDASGHESLVWYLKEYLWPKPSGWNPFFLAGFPQGLFYPSLFHFLAATLSFLTGVESAVKIIVALAIIFLPLAAYYAVKNTVREAKYQLIVTLLALGFLASLPNFLGIGLRGLFQIGLIPNFVSTVLLLAFIGLLHSKFKQGKILLLSLVWAGLILTHIVAVAFAEIYFFVYASLLWRQNELKIKQFVWLMLLVPAMTAFFWVPFWVNFSFTSVSAHVSSYFTLNIILAVAAFISLSFSLRKKLIESSALSATALIILVMAAADSWLIASSSQSPLFDIFYSLHIYRFQPYAYLALILAFGSALTHYKWFKDTKIPRFTTLGLLFALLIYLFVRSPVVTEAKFSVDEKVRLGGRFIETFRRVESAPLLYSAQTKLVMNDPEKNQWAYGLFTDATPNGPYLGSLIRSLRPGAYPESEGRSVETKVINQKNIPKALDLFGIKYKLNLGEVAKGEEIGKWQVGGEEKLYSVEKVGNGELAEVVDLNPIPVDGDFDKKVEEWWDQDGKWSTLPFKAETEIENFDAKRLDPKTKVQISEHNKDWTRFKLNIDSEKNQPVLVKFSYFPWWSAHQDGRDIQIYRAAPNLMLIFANGEVDFAFEEPVWLKLLYSVSAVTLLIVIFQLYKRRTNTP